MLPILILFIPGMAWGFSDPDIILPGGVARTQASEMMRPVEAFEALVKNRRVITNSARKCMGLFPFNGVRDMGVLTRFFNGC